MTDEQNGVTTHTYDAAGNLETLAFPNGLVTTYTYDALNRPLSVITRNAQGAIVGSETYTLHPTGRRTQVASFDGEQTRIQQYRYDLLYRLFEESTRDGAGTLLYSATYTYDRVGNRVYAIEDGVHTQYSYDANDRLLGAGGVSYAYDNAGNLLSETQDGQTKTYTWDAKHKLARASTPQALVDYLYDVDGIRSAKTVNGNTTNYVVDHNTAYAQVLLEADQSGATAAYTRGLALLGQERNGASSYYHADALGSTKQLSDGNGTTTDRYAYTAFGKAQSATGSTPNSYRYTGEQFDDSLGQYYLRARNYDPATGRFTQRDPFAGVASSPVTLHDYLYAGNDPVMNTDPGGQFFSAGGGMVSASISGALRGMQIYSNANVAISFMRSLAAGDTEEAKEIAESQLIEMLGAAAFSRFAAVRKVSVNGASIASISRRIPRIVQSRVVMIRGRPDANGRYREGWLHVVQNHMPPGVSGKGVFTLPSEEVRILIQSPKVIKSPVISVIESRREGRALYERVIDVGYPVGKTTTGVPTSIIVVRTNYKGNLISAYPRD